ncbi:MAG: FtsQ-type POTRA domain-containing protein [Proteobacteria bacterium]|nr:FtsQ-type POTRA domain-containing protein [Pseudomonadota bacterium]
MQAVKSSRRTSSKRQKIQRSSQGNRPLLLLSGLVGVCIFSLWVFFYAPLLVAEISKSFQGLMACCGFRLEDVIVEGRMRTDKAQILSLLELERGKPLFSLNLPESKAKLEKISWVKAARVERQLPNILFIRISEKEPVALWQNQGRTYLMDWDGELMETKEPHKYKSLLVVTGEQAPRHVGELLTLLEKFSELKQRVTGATYLRSMRWDIRLDDKVDVKLPEKEAEGALAYLLDLTKHHQLMKQEIMIIDMRLPGKLIFRLTPEAVEKQKDYGKAA